MDFVIAVDGPAASGKGTVAGGLAAELGLRYLDTGVLYRAVGVLAQQEVGDGATRAEFEGAAIGFAQALRGDNVLDNPIFRTRHAGELASRVAVLPAVREALLVFQRRFAGQPGGAVLDGRDIGTVIAPDAPAKLFVTAAPQVRAERRWRQLADQGETISLEEVLADIVARDARDSNRAAAPLIRADKAVLLDTTEMSISQSADAARRIVQAARAGWERSRTG